MRRVGIGSRGEVAVLPTDVWAIPGSQGRSALLAVGRILCDNGLQPEVCDSVVEWATAGARAKAASERTEATLSEASDLDSDRGMGSGWLSLVRAAKSVAAELDALDSEALSVQWGCREAAAGHERTADGSSPAAQQAAAETQDIRADQARDFVEAPHSGEDGSLGRKRSRLRGDRSGVALGQFGRWGVCAQS